MSKDYDPHFPFPRYRPNSCPSSFSPFFSRHKLEQSPFVFSEYGQYCFSPVVQNRLSITLPTKKHYRKGLCGLLASWRIDNDRRPSCSESFKVVTRTSLCPRMSLFVLVLSTDRLRLMVCGTFTYSSKYIFENSLRISDLYPIFSQLKNPRCLCLQTFENVHITESPQVEWNRNRGRLWSSSG